ncbi:MAG TPA: hypothetical protein VMM15_36865 [Bradyrhizobium sp.]|nr:hypothetical protein [Bradyrhizobium sp.]
MAFGSRRIERQGPIQACDAFLGSALVGQQDAEIRQRFDIVGPQAKGALELLDRLGKLARCKHNLTEIEVGFGAVRMIGDRLAQQRRRLRQPALQQQYRAEIVQGVKVAGMERQCPAIARLGFIQPSQRLKRQAAPKMRIGKLRIELDRLGGVVQGRVELPALIGQIPQQAVGLGGARKALNHPAVQRLGLAQTPAPVMSDRSKEFRRGLSDRRMRGL